MLKYFIIVILAYFILEAGEYFTGIQLNFPFNELNSENLFRDILYFAIAYTIATMVVKIFEPVDSRQEESAIRDNLK